MARRGLQRPPQRKAKRRRLADGSAARLRVQRPNDVWALDFQFDETADLRRIKLLNVVDEFTREALAIEAAHCIDADGVVATVERLVARRGAPAHLRMDNGPELVSMELRGNRREHKVPAQSVFGDSLKRSFPRIFPHSPLVWFRLPLAAPFVASPASRWRGTLDG